MSKLILPFVHALILSAAKDPIAPRHHGDSGIDIQRAAKERSPP
jgi:hypothetical protein